MGLGGDPNASGVSQGSVHGLTLGIILCGLLRSSFATGVSMMGCADDIALVMTGEIETDVMLRENVTIGIVDWWLREHLLALAPEKTEAVGLAGRRLLTEIRFKVPGSRAYPKDSLKYLGIWLDLP